MSSGMEKDPLTQHIRVDDAVGKEAINELLDMFEDIQEKNMSPGKGNQYTFDINDVDLGAGFANDKGKDEGTGEHQTNYSGFSGIDKGGQHIITGNRGIIEQWDEENDD